VEIAVIGSGISGLAAAYYLSRRHRVTVFEKDDRLGGHAHTHTVEIAGKTWTLDTGFIVYNHKTYPSFVRLLGELGVESQPSDMSFGVRCRRCRLEYSSRGPRGLFAQPRRLIDGAHLRTLADIPRFNRRARAFLGAANGGDPVLGEFLDAGGYSSGFVRHFLLPMGGAVWSASTGDVRGFSARSFLRFFDNHGWLTLTGAPPWRTVRGGSRSYVDAIARPFAERIHLSTPVLSLRRDETGVEVRTSREARRFDKAVLATHADQALTLLADPSDAEAGVLRRFRYSRNEAVLHTDGTALPFARAAWASWNCDVADCRDEAAPVSMTYHLNRLQSLGGSTTFCVSLNRPEPAPGTVLARMTYTHPVMDQGAIDAQKALAGLNGHRHTYWAGAHLGYGFHEDGLRSALAVARHLGVDA
jgi:predicted NAD/FAD-binding protein